MKHILTAILLVGIWTSGLSQCEDETNFSISVSNQVLFNTTGQPTCYLAQDINYVMENEVVYFYLNEINQTTPEEITWTDNGTQFANQSFSGIVYNDVSLTGYNHSFATDGVHEIICTYEFETGCSISDTFNITIYDRICPFLQWDHQNNLSCVFPESPVVLTINSDPNIDILNCDWEITNGSTNDIYNYTSSGNTFTFYPQVGVLSAYAYVTVELANGDICYTEICTSDAGEGTLGWFKYSDPFFELQGILEEGEDIDVVFKGTNIEPLPADDHQYTLEEGTLPTLSVVAGVDEVELVYNQVMTTLNYSTAGEYTVRLTGEYYDRTCPDEYEVTFTIDDENTDPVECESCNTFKPIIGERYWISAWVKEDHTSQVKTYTNASIELDFIGAMTLSQFTTTGDIVEGWQRIVGSFTIPTGTTDLDINLVNGSSTIDAFFDDVRIHPFNSSMKSYVYDPETLWLTAELDDNNYATFYEYDNEGNLTRIKKETERGIVTIQESRSGNPKND